MDEACLCGSGDTFENCCKALVDTTSNQAVAEFNNGNFAKAEKLFRAFLTRYIGWVRDHTLPVKETPVYRQLVEIDVRALLSLADLITKCLAHQGKDDELIPFVDALERNVPLKEFNPSAVYLRAVCHYIYLNDRAAAVTDLERLGNPRQIKDSETLELYLDVFSESLSELEKLPLVEQVLEQPRSRAVELQYGLMRVILYSFLGDDRLATRALDPLVASVRSRMPAQPTRDQIEGWDEIRLSARILDHSFHLTGNRRDYEEALALYKQMREAPLRASGAAEILRESGALQISGGEHEAALTTLNEALQLESSDVIRIRLVFALLGLERTEEAASVLESISLAKLPELLELEYWHAAAALAIARRNEHALDDALARLRNLTLPGVYWPRARDHVVEELSKRIPIESGGRLAKALRLASTYFDVKPGLFGLSVNLNAVLEGVADRLDKGASTNRPLPAERHRK